MPRARIYLARDAAITEARRAGSASLKQLADQHGVSVERIRQISERGGVSNVDAAAAFARRRNEINFNEAEQYEAAILMRWIGGENVSDIAHSLEIPVSSAQAVLDEKITIEIEAARRANQVRQRFPEVDPGPKNDHEPRDDRYWTREKCLETLYHLAVRNGGTLPSSTNYKSISSSNEDLPSFPTVRNRCGRWSQVRLQINQMMRASA